MPASQSRSQIAEAAAAALEKLGKANALRPALVGFDGFIDSIISVVDQRHDMSPDGYERIKTIEQFARRVGAAAGKSTNIELVVKEDRFGGNGPLMAGAARAPRHASDLRGRGRARGQPAGASPDL